MSHLQLIADEDLPRFRASGVIANFEPYWCQYDDFQTRLTVPRLGDRGSRQYPINTVLKTGARLSFGSDWPVSTLNPLEGLRVAVSRAVADEQPWLPEQRMTLADALRTYTVGTAYQAGAEDRRGQIAP